MIDSIRARFRPGLVPEGRQNKPRTQAVAVTVSADERRRLGLGTGGGIIDEGRPERPSYTEIRVPAMHGGGGIISTHHEGGRHA